MSLIHARLTLVAHLGLTMLLLIASVALMTVLASCQLEYEREGQPTDPDDADRRSRTELSILTWNIEWFQHPERGPPDDALQFESVLDVLEATGASLVALQEVSDLTRFYDLLDRLPHYAGVITAHAWPQQLALLYRRREFTFLASHALLGLDDAGRPPLAVELRHASGARAVVIVVHAKAGSTPSDHARRERFARGLIPALAGHSEAQVRVVLGDFNDRLDGSLVSDRLSPYATLLADTGLVSPTAALERGSEPSTIWGDTVDHILVDPVWNETPPAVVDVLRDELLADYPEYVREVSDHFPVRLRASVRLRGEVP